jgi:hypothetical protein
LGAEEAERSMRDVVHPARGLHAHYLWDQTQRHLLSLRCDRPAKCDHLNPHDFDFDGIPDCLDPDIDNDTDVNQLDPEPYAPDVFRYNPAPVMSSWGKPVLYTTLDVCVVGTLLDVCA